MSEPMDADDDPIHWDHGQLVREVKRLRAEVEQRGAALARTVELLQLAQGPIASVATTGSPIAAPKADAYFRAIDDFLSDPSASSALAERRAMEEVEKALRNVREASRDREAFIAQGTRAWIFAERIANLARTALLALDAVRAAKGGG